MEIDLKDLVIGGLAVGGLVYAWKNKEEFLRRIRSLERAKPKIKVSKPEKEKKKDEEVPF